MSLQTFLSSLLGSGGFWIFFPISLDFVGFPFFHATNSDGFVYCLWLCSVLGKYASKHQSNFVQKLLNSRCEFFTYWGWRWRHFIFISITFTYYHLLHPLLLCPCNCQCEFIIDLNIAGGLLLLALWGCKALTLTQFPRSQILFVYCKFCLR